MSSESRSIDSLGDRLMGIFWRKPAATIAERTRRRVTLHLVPYLFFLYIIAYVDRMNIAVAKLGMTESPEVGGLGFTNEIIGMGAGIFFIGYWILEIPSTLWVERRGARWVFVRILILWGIMAAIMASIGTPLAARMFGWLPQLSEDAGWLSSAAQFINGLPTNPKYQFYFFRFLLGFFEGGFFPSVILYLTHWFRTEDRARAMASFFLAMPLSSVIGYPISLAIKNHVDWFGLEGWRWIFIVEGIIPVLAGIATIFMLPDRPPQAKWLPDDERQWLMAELDRERLQKKQLGHFAWHNHVVMVLLLTVVYFCQNVTAYGFSTFMPTIMKSQLNSLPVALQSLLGLTGQMSAETLRNRRDFAATLLGALPYCLAMVGLLVNGWHSDRTRERLWHTATPLIVASLGVYATWFLLGHGYALAAVLVLIVVVGSCLYTHCAAFWPIPTMFLGASAAASAIGFINMTGNLGGFWGPKIVGEAADTSIAEALTVIAPWSYCGAMILLLMGYWQRRKMRPPAPPPAATVQSQDSSPH